MIHVCTVDMGTGRIIDYGVDNGIEERMAELIDIPEDKSIEDIGISTPDAQAIKQTLLAAVREGFVEAGDVSTLASDLIGAFKDIDNEVFARDSMQKQLTSIQK